MLFWTLNLLASKIFQISLAQSPFFLLNLHQGKCNTPFTLEEEILCSFLPITKGFFPPSIILPPSPFFLLYEQKKHQPHPVFCLLYWTSLITVFGWFLIIAPSIYFLCKLPQNSLNQGVFKYFYWATLLCINSIFPIYFICYTYCKIYIIIKHAFLIYFILLYLLISYLQ